MNKYDKSKPEYRKRLIKMIKSNGLCDGKCKIKEDVCPLGAFGCTTRPHDVKEGSLNLLGQLDGWNRGIFGALPEDFLSLCSGRPKYEIAFFHCGDEGIKKTGSSPSYVEKQLRLGDNDIHYFYRENQAPPAVISHRDRMTLWWEVEKETGTRWYRVTSYSPRTSFDTPLYEIAGVKVKPCWFDVHKSAELPQE